jgi:hypothetical protein
MWARVLNITVSMMWHHAYAASLLYLSAVCSILSNSCSQLGKAKSNCYTVYTTNELELELEKFTW